MTVHNINFSCQHKTLKVHVESYKIKKNKQRNKEWHAIEVLITEISNPALLMSLLYRLSKNWTPKDIRLYNDSKTFLVSPFLT